MRVQDNEKFMNFREFQLLRVGDELHHPVVRPARPVVVVGEVDVVFVRGHHDAVGVDDRDGPVRGEVVEASGCHLMRGGVPTPQI